MAEDTSETETRAVLSTIHDISDLDLEELLRVPMVELATRRTQSLYDAPGSLTVFEADEIVSAGISSPAEVLRRVPGMSILQLDGGNFSAGLRGVNRPYNNCVLVLVDGRNLAEMDDTPLWSTFPVHVNEIARIEVLRGPATTMYGSGALTGVINIVTRKPLDAPNIEAVFAAGNSYLPDVPDDGRGPRVGQLGNGHLRVPVVNASKTLALNLMATWNHVPNWQDLTSFTRVRSGDFGYHLGAALDYRPSRQNTFFLEARHTDVEGARSFAALTTERIADYASEQVLSGLWRYRGVLPGLDLSAGASGKRSAHQSNAADLLGNYVYRKPSLYTARTQAQADYARWNGRSTTSLGVEFTYQTLRDFGETDNRSHQEGVVLQNETVLSTRRRTLLNVGVRFDRLAVGIVDQPTTVYTSISPRIALISYLRREHALLLVAGMAARYPSNWESAFNLVNPRTDPSTGTTPAYVQVGNPSLRPEQVRSIELGYRSIPLSWLSIDTVIYTQQFRDRILNWRAALPMQYDNGPKALWSGIEIGTRMRPRPNYGGYLNYAFTHSWTSGADQQPIFFPTHLASVGADLRHNPYRFNVDFHCSSRATARFLSINSNMLLTDRQQMTWQPVLNLRVGRKLLDGRAEVFLMGANVLAVLRDRSDLAAARSVEFEPIGAIFLAGVRVSEAKEGVGP